MSPSITRLGSNACRLLGIALVPAYTSSVLAALLSMAAGYTLIPIMNTATEAAQLRELPKDIFAIQDSFGTACNITGDGALSLILIGYCEEHGLEEQSDIGVEL